MKQLAQPISRLSLLLGILLCSCPVVHAALEVEVTRGVSGAFPIAVVPFGGSLPGTTQMAEVIENDLVRSGRFAAVPQGQFPERPTAAEGVHFDAWRGRGAESLVIGQLQQAPDGQFTIQFRLFDLVRQAQLAGYDLRFPPGQWRIMAHRIADIIYERLTGERGAFGTRIAYVRVGRSGPEQFALCVADSDGANEQIILRSRQPIVSPAWSPDGRRIAYVSFESRFPAIFVQEVYTGQRQKISSRPGLNSAPTWSPDGQSLIMTLSRGGNADLYRMDLASRQLQQLTNDPAIDTEAGFAPDGQSIVFTSDRGGTPQIYQMNLQDGAVKRLTFEGRYNARARFSPDGRYLAMVRGDGRHYRIGVMRLEDGLMRYLSSGPLDEAPSFSPNGAMIIFSRAAGQGSELATVSFDGRIAQRLVSRGFAVRDPAWSPFPQAQ